MRRQDKYPDTDIFHFENCNPKNRITTDCVVRAIAKATAPSIAKDAWQIIYEDLCNESIETGFSFNDTKCYGKYLEKTGFKAYPQLRKSDNTKMTLKEFIELHPTGTWLVNMPSHLTVVINGINYDIWDCTKSDKRVEMYWGKEY